MLAHSCSNHVALSARSSAVDPPQRAQGPPQLLPFSSTAFHFFGKEMSSHPWAQWEPHQSPPFFTAEVGGKQGRLHGVQEAQEVWDRQQATSVPRILSLGRAWMPLGPRSPPNHWEVVQVPLAHSPLGLLPETPELDVLLGHLLWAPPSCLIS